MTDEERNDLQDIITHALEEIKAEQGASFSLDKVNLAEMERLTGITRKRLRKIKKDGFHVLPSKARGKHKEKTVLTGYTGVIDDRLKHGVTNSENIFSLLQKQGYTGGKTSVKDYIHSHKDLVPATRIIVAPQGNRGRRYTTGPGDTFQMDWGFLRVETDDGGSYRASCFAMICHCCGDRFAEFFPNAKQENLFIGMIHGFLRMGVPKYILTDNMKSVTTGRDINGQPIWNNDYADFMKAIGFETKVCKARHPFTKGKVERLIRFVKENFMQGRTFSNITELNYEALRWCDEQNDRYHQCVDCKPAEKHARECLPAAKQLQMTSTIMQYLCPIRKISFDGFVSYEGRRFGVPYWYTSRTCRVSRQDFTLYIYSMDCKKEITHHDVTWSRRDSFCKDQYAVTQPEEEPTAPVATTMYQNTDSQKDPADEFNFDKEVEW